MIKEFEELKCWKESRKLVFQIYCLCRDSNHLRRDFELSRQLKRASLSVMNNIAEGFSRFHKSEFIRFLDIAQSSASEVLSMLYIIEDLDFADKSELEKLRDQTGMTKRLILGLVRHLRKPHPP